MSFSALWAGASVRDTGSLASRGVPADAGAPASCTLLGALLLSGALPEEGAEGDPTLRGQALLQQGCDGGDPGGCFQLGMGVLQTDAQRAAALLTQGCDGGVAAACTRLAHCHCDGYGVPKNLERAAALFKAACEQSSLECGWQPSCR